MSRPRPQFARNFRGQGVILRPERRLNVDGSPTRVMPQGKDNQSEHEPDKKDPREALDRSAGRRCHRRFAGRRDTRSPAHRPKGCWRPARVPHAAGVARPGRPARVRRAVGVPCGVHTPCQRRYNGSVRLLQLWHWLALMETRRANGARSCSPIEVYHGTSDVFSPGRSRGHLGMTVARGATLESRWLLASTPLILQRRSPR